MNPIKNKNESADTTKVAPAETTDRADITDSTPKALTIENTTHFRAPNGRIFPATDVLRQMATSDGKLQPCVAPKQSK